MLVASPAIAGHLPPDRGANELHFCASDCAPVSF